MRCFRAWGAVVLGVVGSVSVCGGQTYTWTGTSGTSLLAAGNWSLDGTATQAVPQAGDRIAIPSGKTVKVDTESEAEWLKKLAGVDLDGTLTYQIKKTFAPAANSFTLAGAGQFRCISSSTVTLNGDNSAFTGSFFFSNTAVKVRRAFALGVTCAVTNYVLGSGTVMTFCKNMVLDNPFYVDSGSSNYGLATSSSSDGETCAVTNRGPLVCRSDSNAMFVRLASGSKKAFVFSGGIDCLNGSVVLNGPVKITGGSRFRVPGRLYCDSSKEGTPEISSVLAEGSGEVRVSKATIAFAKTNVVNGADLALHAGLATLDLNGFDQTAAVLYSSSASPSQQITSVSAPAVLTLTGQPTYDKWVTAKGVAAHFGRFSGHVGLRFQCEGGELALGNAADWPSLMDGALEAKAGQIRLTASARYPNVSAWRATGGTLAIEKGAEVRGGAPLTVSDGGTVSLAEGVELVVRTARVDGDFIPAGTYGTGGASKPDFLVGEGTLVVQNNSEPLEDPAVFVWRGGTGRSLQTAANWEGNVAPKLEGGAEMLCFSGDAATMPEVTGAIRVYGIRIEGVSANGFTLGGTGLVAVGWGGLTIVKDPAAESPVVTIEPSLRVWASEETWTVPSTVSVDMRGNLASDSELIDENARVTITGTGLLDLRGDNRALRPQLLLTERCVVRCRTDTALGASTRPVTVRRLPLFYGTRNNAVPLIVKESSTSDEKSYLTTGSDGNSVCQTGKIRFDDNLSGTSYLILHHDELRGGIETAGSRRSLWVKSQKSTNPPLISGPVELANQGAMIIDDVFKIRLSATTGNRYSRLQLYRAQILCEAENVVCPDAVFQFGHATWTGTTRDGRDTHGDFVMNGYDQTVKAIEFGPLEACRTKAPTDRGYVISQTPATLTVTGDYVTNTLWIVFSGAASFNYTGGGRLTFTNAFSQTSGTLSVTSGTLVFEAGSGWKKAEAGGTNSVRVAGGRLEVQSWDDTVFGGSESGTKLFVSDGGKLSIPAGTVVTVSKLCINGREARAGWYTRTEVAGAYRNETIFAETSSGTLRVLRSDSPGFLMLLH